MKTKPKKKNPLSNPKSPESRIRMLEQALFELSCASVSVIYDLSYTNLKRLDESLSLAEQVLPNRVTRPL